MVPVRPSDAESNDIFIRLGDDTGTFSRMQPFKSGHPAPPIASDRPSAVCKESHTYKMICTTKACDIAQPANTCETICVVDARSVVEAFCAKSDTDPSAGMWPRWNSEANSSNGHNNEPAHAHVVQ